MKRVKALAAMSMAAVLTFSMSMSAFAAEGFDAAYYAAQNPDVVAAVGMEPAALELHYETFGRAEGRAANPQDVVGQTTAAGIVGLEQFDAEYYAAQNPDVAAVYGTDALSLYLHYMNFGAAEGRAPSAAAKASADAAKKASDSSENPYARFASSTSSSSHKSSKRSSSKSESSSETSGTDSGTTQQHQLSYTSNDDGTHNVECSVTDCTEGHAQDNVACDIWSYTEAASVGTHTKTCSDCGYETTESCTVGYTDKTQTQHTKCCAVCGAEDAAPESHTYSNGVCSVCGYECDHQWDNGACTNCTMTCTHSDFTYTSDNSGNHTPTCGICGQEQSPAACSYGSWEKVDNSNHKKTCSDCGHEETAAHDWNASTGKCNDCGAECEHNWSDESGTCGTCSYECTHGATESGNTCETCGKTLD